MLDTRRQAARLLGKLEISSASRLIKLLVAATVAAVIALVPEYSNLDPAAMWTLFILIFAAGLWVSEAIPAFAVAILIIGLEILILGKPGGVYATGVKDWQMFVAPWSSPVMWLFLGGFVLGQAAETTGLDRMMARFVLKGFGKRPSVILLGVMGITFIFSMFMSNTATTAMMMSVMAPVIATIDKKDPFIKALLLGIPFSANVGGMATIIGSPPNAIAAGLLSESHNINFTQWIMAGLPPALFLFFIIWLYLKFAHPSKNPRLDLRGLEWETRTGSLLPTWKRILVFPVFMITVLLWMTGPLHGMPTAVVSFIPITVFAVTGILNTTEIKRLNWDVLLLLAGGLSLGIAIQKTGLAEWLLGLLPIRSLGMMALAFLLAYATTLLSNFMSNTAATNILAPLGMAVAVGFEPIVVISLAMGASMAMGLPISTPPNAIAFASGDLKSTDFLRGGLLMGLLGPAVIVIWVYWLLG
ncbi:MAG: DASS family sodium-coupled anion symporter [Candidatus Marinimicrobia bacterium]|nr:DASS family sodium-coupled anion symporter [Candidatus Neomarinimicrobiota bacterium]